MESQPSYRAPFTLYRSVLNRGTSLPGLRDSPARPLNQPCAGSLVPLRLTQGTNPAYATGTVNVLGYLSSQSLRRKEPKALAARRQCYWPWYNGAVASGSRKRRHTLSDGLVPQGQPARLLQTRLARESRATKVTQHGGWLTPAPRASLPALALPIPGNQKAAVTVPFEGAPPSTDRMSRRPSEVRIEGGTPRAPISPLKP